jgi:transcription elongation factor GreA
MATDSVWMTLGAQQRLVDELQKCERAVAAGDSSAEARIVSLRSLLRNAEVGAKPDDGLVEPGMKVTVRFTSDDSQLTFLFGSRELAALDPTIDVEVYSPTSPLGAAITGRYVGDVVQYPAPSGALEAEIVAAAPFD